MWTCEKERKATYTVRSIMNKEGAKAGKSHLGNRVKTKEAVGHKERKADSEGFGCQVLYKIVPTV